MNGLFLRICFLLAMVGLVKEVGWGQTPFTAAYNLSLGSNDVSTFPYNGSPITGAIPGPLNKVGITSSGSSGNFRGTNWPTGATNGSNTFSGAVNLGKYIQVSVEAASGYEISITSIIFGIGRSGTGFRQTQWRGSADNFANPINNYTALNAGLSNSGGTLTNPDADSNWTGNVLNVSASYSNVTGIVTFRIYGFNSEAAGGTGGLQGNISIVGTYTAVASCTPPATQATNFATSNIQSNQMDASWMRGSGANVLVVARQGAAVNADPMNAKTYTANGVFGSGEQIGIGNYVVYKGTGNAQTVSNLMANTAYHYAVYEFDGAVGSECYRISDKLTGNATTLSVPPVISHVGTTPVPSNILQGAVNNILYQIELSATAAPATLTQVVATTAGTWDNDDLVNFKLRYSTDATLSAGDGTLATVSTGLNGASQDIVFTGFGQSIPVGTRYLFLTCDVAVGATLNNTIAAGMDADSDFTYTEAESNAGSSFAVANAMTIIGIPELQLEYPIGVDADCSFTLPFGNVPVNTNASLSFRIRNIGMADLSLTSLPLVTGGTHANQFSITTQPSSPIAPGAFADVTVQFLPSSTGSKTAFISIANNDGNESTCAVNLTGTGVLANDDCSGAIPIAVDAGPVCSSATNGTTVTATQSVSAFLCNGFTGNADDDVWYSFVATATAHTITVIGTSPLDPVIDLRSGACNGTTIACADATAGGGTEVLEATGLTINSTYLVRIYGYGTGNTTKGAFSICVTTPLPPLHFRTKNSGSWSSPLTWQASENGVNWSDALAAPDKDDLSISILSSHTVTIDASVNVDQIIVGIGSLLEVTSSGALTLSDGAGTDLLVQGILKNSTQNQFSLDPGATIVIDNGGKYQHNPSIAGSMTPMTWNLGATCEILRASAKPGGTLDQAYQHFIWNSANQGATTLNLTNELKTINGNFLIQNTGTGSLRLASSGNTLNVGGNVVISNGTDLDLGNGSGISTVNVNGDLTVNGTLELMGGSSANGFVNLKGNLLGSGLITENTSGTGCLLTFSGTTPQSASFGTLSNRVNILINNVQGVGLNSPLTMTNSADLALSAGRLTLNAFNLNMTSSNTTITGGSAASYIQTNSTGVLQRTVSNASGSVAFPVGNNGYNPATIANSGTSDIFSVRVEDQVLAGGTSGSPKTTEVVNKTWLVTENVAGGSNTTLTVEWNGADELNGFTRNNCYLSHYTMGGWQQTPEGAASGGNPYTRVLSGVTSFSPFAVWSQAPLPIELTLFEATRTGKKAELFWSTAAELNNDYFQIERSADGRSFDPIGQMAGAGTSYVRNDYRFTDEKPFTGWNYYRLKQVDFDGQFAYSQLRAVNFEQTPSAESELNVFPNPTGNVVFWKSANPVHAGDRIAVFDLTGRQLQNWSAYDLIGTPLDVSKLPAGPYILRLYSGKSIFNASFVKQ